MPRWFHKGDRVVTRCEDTWKPRQRIPRRLSATVVRDGMWGMVVRVDGATEDYTWPRAYWELAPGTDLIPVMTVLRRAWPNAFDEKGTLKAF